MSEENELQHKIKQKNLFAVFLIAILVSSSYFILIYLSQTQKHVAELINISGSQRMYSQKIALEANRHFQSISTGLIDLETKARLVKSADTLKKNHEYIHTLLATNLDEFSDELRQLYYDNPINLHNKIIIYINAVNELIQTDDPLIAYTILKQHFDADLVENFLADLNNAVQLLVKDASKKREQVETIETILWLAMLVILIIVYFFILQPMQFSIKNSYQALLLSKRVNDEIKFAINKHAVVYRLNMKGQITYINDRFTDLYGYEDAEIVGQNVFKICDDSYTQADYENIFKVCAKEEYWHGESLNKIKGGRQLWVDTTIVPLKGLEKRIDSFIVIQNDISGIKQTELALNKLHKITSNVNFTIEDKVNKLLLLGKQLFNLPFAVISEVTCDEYKVVYCDTPNHEITPHDVFELSNTYCIHALNANGPISFHHASDDEIKHHPCFESFGLESYIGVPLHVDGEVYGTLNFSSFEPSLSPFTERELELIQLFANWLGSELTRENHQNKLYNQQALVEEMGQQARIGAWEVDLVNERIYWSKVVKEIHEVPDAYEPDLSTAINFYKAGEHREKIKQLVAKSIEDGSSYETELQLITHKGNEIWISARGRSEFKRGQCVRLYGSFQEITAQKIAEENIKKNSQRLRLAADSAGIGVWVLNLIDNSLQWDDWMFKIYGVTPDQFSGAYEAWENGLHPDDKEASVTLLAQAVKGEKKFDTQFRIIWPTGEVKHIRASAIVTKSDDGTPMTMVGVNYDVTEDIENKQALTKAKTLAESAVIAKNEFLASMSHEIRTPMNGVIGMLSLLNDSKLTSEQQHRITIAKESADSLLLLINDILDFSKIEANKLELEKIPFNLSQMMGSLALSLAQQAQHKGLELILDLTGVNDSLVIGDPNRLRQIITNLVSNAIKFTEKGEVIIRLSLINHSQTQWQLSTEVIDEGIGITKAQETKLFTAFTQVDASTTRKYGGTGLGLAIVKKLCENMGGTIKLKPSNRQGSHFISTILLEKSEQSSSLILDAKTDNNVLIIDSNESHIKTLSYQLDDWGYNVVSSTKNNLLSVCEENAKKAILFNFIFINHELANTEEGPINQTLMEKFGYKNCHVIFMAPLATNINNKQLEALGADQLLVKPLTHESLKNALGVNTKNQPAVEKAPNSDTIEEPEASPITWSKKVKVLLVEDNRVNQMVAKGVLKKIGLTCDVAINGLEAIKQLNNSLKDEPYTFIFMDCQMPEMDGYQATQAIRIGEAGDNYRDIPIVAMTANAMVGDKEKCIDAGMDDYITKPIAKERIQEILMKYLA